VEKSISEQLEDIKKLFSSLPQLVKETVDRAVEEKLSKQESINVETIPLVEPEPAPEEIESLFTGTTQELIPAAKKESFSPIPPQDISSANFGQEEINPQSHIIDYEMSGGGKGGRTQQCSRQKMSIGKRKNKFVDNKSVASGDADFDKKVRHAKIQKRPPAQKVIVTCNVCRRTFRIDPQLSPVRFEGNEGSTFRCDGCLPGRAH
jgi:hypothetical protein